ncbi:hypothetical protein [Halomonas lysinitropha]|uniref:hypothetical protein n=1 Tax=Halomonas lysinitropha TaxID=2607506 RepID=UPI001788D96C|nr:hypothetical protein [Halomonas lysinitropha]
MKIRPPIVAIFDAHCTRRDDTGHRSRRRPLRVRRLPAHAAPRLRVASCLA